MDNANVPPVKQKILKIIASSGSYVPTNEIGLNPKMTDVWFEAIDKVCLGQMTPEQASARLDEMAKENNWYK